MPDEPTTLNFLFPDPFVEAYYDQLDAARRKRSDELGQQLTYQNAKAAVDLSMQYPNLPKAVIAAAAVAGFEPSDGMDQVAIQADIDTTKNLWDYVYGGAKAGVRGAFTIFDTLWEEVAARPIRTAVAFTNQGPTVQEARQIEQAYGLEEGYLSADDRLYSFGGLPADKQQWFDKARNAGFTFSQENMSLGDAYRRAGASTGVRALGQIFSGQRVNLGEGFIPRSEVAEDQPGFDQMAAQYGVTAARERLQAQLGAPIRQQATEQAESLTWRGAPISPGRLLGGFGGYLNPDTEMYNLISGMGDAAALIAGGGKRGPHGLDPSNILLKRLGATRAANKMVHATAAGVDATGAIRGATRSTIFRPTVDGFLASRRGQRLITYLNNTTPDDLADVMSLFGRKYRQAGRDTFQRFVDGDDAESVLREMMTTRGQVDVPVPRTLSGQLLETATGGRVSGTLGTAWGGLIGGDIGRLGGFRAGLRHRLDQHGWGRQFRIMGDRTLSLEDLNTSLWGLDDFLIGLGLKPTERSQFLHRWSKLDPYSTADDGWAIVKDASGLRRDQLQKMYEGLGVDKKLANAMATKATESFGYLDDFRKYATDEAGETMWFPGSRVHLALIGSEDDILGAAGAARQGNRVMPTASMASEFLAKEIPLPNMRALRKAQGKTRRLLLTRNASGESLAEFLRKDPFGENMLNRIADPFMQRFWKPLALLRLAWPVRVLGEEQFRMSAKGLTSMFNHPLDYMGFVMVDSTGSAFRRTMARVGIKPRGQTGGLEGLLPDGISTARLQEAEHTLRKYEDSLADRFGIKRADIRRRPDEMFDGMAEAGDLTATEARAIQDEIARLRGSMDEQMQGFGSVGLAERDVLLRLSDEAQAAQSHRGEFFLGQSRNAAYRDAFTTYPRTDKAYPAMFGGELRQLFMDDLAPRIAANGVDETVEWFLSSAEDAVALRNRLAQSSSGLARSMKQLDRGGAAELYVRYLDARIKIKTGGSVNAEWQTAGGEWVRIDTGNVPKEFIDLAEEAMNTGKGWERIRYQADPSRQPHEELHDLVATGQWRGYDLREVVEGSDLYDQFIDDLSAEFRDVGPEYVKGPAPSGWQSKAGNWWDSHVDTWFDWLMSKPTNKLSRHPAFMQFYWQRAGDLIGFAAPQVQETFLKGARAANLPRRQIRALEHAAAQGRAYRASRVGVTKARAQMVLDVKAMESEDLIALINRNSSVLDGAISSTDDVIDVLSRGVRDGDEGLTQALAALAELRRRLPVFEDDYRRIDAAIQFIHGPAGKEVESVFQYMNDTELLDAPTMWSVAEEGTSPAQLRFRIGEELEAAARFWDEANAVPRAGELDDLKGFFDEILDLADDPTSGFTFEDVRGALRIMAIRNGGSELWYVVPGDLDEWAGSLAKLRAAVSSRVMYPHKIRTRIAGHLAGQLKPRAPHAALTLDDLRRAGIVPDNYRPDIADPLQIFDEGTEAAGRATFEGFRDASATGKGPIGPGGIFRDGPVVFRGRVFNDWMDLLDYANTRGWTVDEFTEFVDEMQLPPGMRTRERLIKPVRGEKPKPPMPEEAFGQPSWPGGKTFYHGGWVTTGDETLDVGRPELNQWGRRIRPIEEADPQNLYGPGLYTTDARGIAEGPGGYTHMKASAEHIGGTPPKGRRIEWTGEQPPRVLDLETQMPTPEIDEALQRAVDRWLDTGFGDADDDILNAMDLPTLRTSWARQERDASQLQYELGWTVEDTVGRLDMPVWEKEDLYNAIRDRAEFKVESLDVTPPARADTVRAWHEAIDEAAEAYRARMATNPAVDVSDFPEQVERLHTAIDGTTVGPQNMRAVYDILKHEWLDEVALRMSRAGLRPEDFSEMQGDLMREINVSLRDSGWDALAHEGGQNWGDRSHQVMIFLDTSKVKAHIDRWEGYIPPDMATFDRPIRGTRPPARGAKPALGKPTDAARRPTAVGGSNKWVKADDGRIVMADELARETRQHAFEDALDDPRVVALTDELDDIEAAALAGDTWDEIRSPFEMDELLKGHALDSVKGLLYDTSRKHSFMDAYRNVFPFGEAWIEIISNWTKLMYENPNIWRRAQQLVEGGRESGFFHRDESTNEEMFTYPASGVLMGFFGKLLDLPVVRDLPVVGSGGDVADILGAGSGVQFEGRLQGLNLVAGQWLPGVGPVIQVPASHLLDWSAFDGLLEAVSPWSGIEVRDWLKERVLPFGEQKLDGSLWKFTPAWFRRLYSAIGDGDETMARLKGNTTIEVLKTLILQGAHPEDEVEAAELLARAERMATQLVLIRGIVQFGSPTGPEVKFYTHVDLPPQELADFLRPNMIGMTPEQRDVLYDRVYNAADHAEGVAIAEAAGIDFDKIRNSAGQMWLYQSLASAYRERLFGESGGDDADAFDWFVRMFGMEPTVFATPMTIQVERRHTTYTGDQWARSHNDLFVAAPLTAYYARPDLELDPFEYGAYTRQLEEGARVPLDPRQWLWRRNDTLGRIIYEKAKVDADALYGERDSKQKDTALAAARLQIGGWFPGFRQPIPGAPESPSTASKISELVNVWFATDPDGGYLYPELAGSSTGRALWEYLTYRERVKAEAVRRGLQPDSWATSTKTDDLRDGVRRFAAQLQEAEPDFMHLWTQVLSHELLDDESPATLGNITDEEAERAVLVGSVGE